MRESAPWSATSSCARPLLGVQKFEANQGTILCEGPSPYTDFALLAML